MSGGGRIELADVTLREGDQMPGREYTYEGKLAAGRALSRLGVSYIQAGFPITGEKDIRVTRDLAREVDADVSALARARPGDVDACLDAEADVVEVFAPLSDLHLEHAIGTTREEMLVMLTEAVDRAHDGGAAAHVSLVDAFRTDRAILAEAIDDLGVAEYVTLADSVGARTPDFVGPFLCGLGEDVDLSGVGVHFHDDLGVATANALRAVDAGIGKVDVSVASLGERAGNPAIEQVVVASVLDYDEDFGIDYRELLPVCEEVLETLGEEIDPRAAILGSEVTTHEAGIHTAAMLTEPSTFEPFDPEEFGGERRLIFGTGTGRGGAVKLLERADVTPTDEVVGEYLDRLAERGPLDTDEAVALARSAFDD